MNKCPHCGAPVKPQGSERFLCEFCGETIVIRQEAPRVENRSYEQQPLQREVVYVRNEHRAVNANVQEGHDWLTTLLLCFFLGCCGVHRFYTKSTGIGVAQLLTLGGCGFWTLIDFIMILAGNYRDGDGRQLVKK